MRNNLREGITTNCVAGVSAHPIQNEVFERTFSKKSGIPNLQRPQKTGCEWESRRVGYSSYMYFETAENDPELPKSCPTWAYLVFKLTRSSPFDGEK